MTAEAVPPPPWTCDEVQFWSIVYIQAPREKVFAHLVSGELTRQFYLGMPISNPVEVGQAMWFGDDKDNPAIAGEVKELQPPEKFSHTFRFPFFDDPESLVEFSLFDESPELTAMIIRHSGFESRESMTFTNICGGWPTILSSLKTLLETGTPLVFPDPQQEEE